MFQVLTGTIKNLAGTMSLPNYMVISFNFRVCVFSFHMIFQKDFIVLYYMPFILDSYPLPINPPILDCYSMITNLALFTHVL